MKCLCLVFSKDFVTFTKNDQCVDSGTRPPDSVMSFSDCRYAALTGGGASCCRVFSSRSSLLYCFLTCFVAENAANVMLATWKLQKRCQRLCKTVAGGATGVSRSCRGRSHLRHVEFRSTQKCFAPHEYHFFASISGSRFHFKAMRHYSTYFP